jgi:hypothetical protein
MAVASGNWYGADDAEKSCQTIFDVVELAEGELKETRMGAALQPSEGGQGDVLVTADITMFEVNA